MMDVLYIYDTGREMCCDDTPRLLDQTTLLSCHMRLFHDSRFGLVPLLYLPSPTRRCSCRTKV